MFHRALARLRAAFPVLSLALALLPAVPAASAATLPAGFTEDLVASGLDNPTAMALAPDGRLFVCEQGGALRVVKNGALLPTPFLTLPVSSVGERGLLGIAFDPGFASNHFLYVYYTATSPAAHNRVSRFTANGDTAVPGSETVLLDLDNLDAAIHNGGAMHFGPDGKLYIAVGENGNSANAQSFGTRLGKILRVNADGTVPTDNPFFSTTTGANRAIWALGVRNPFTFSFQPGTGRMFINDVGESTWEEIDDGVAGSNYGWPVAEGPTTDPRFRSPLFWYGHGATSTTGCAISGGAFYNPATPQFPSNYVGSYFFADYCGGWIRRFDPASGNAFDFATGISSPVDLAVAADGSLYYLARDAGSVFRVHAQAGPGPQITAQPAGRTVAVGQTATFTVGASGTGLRYQWWRNSAQIAGATAASYTTPPAALSDDGAVYSVVVSNDSGSVTSNGAVLTVKNNGAPTATIASPANNTLYSGGDTLTFSGGGTDPEDGTLPPSALTWQVDFHHDTHLHPFMPATSGIAGGTFTIPRAGETSSNVWYRILLTVRDSSGLTATTFVDVVPRKVTLSFATVPPGLQVTLDGQPLATPASVVGVVGISRTLGVVSPQTVNGVTYQFQSWSDGGAASHGITTPASNTTYTATFQATGTPPPPAGNGLAATYWNNMDFTGASVSRVDPTIDFNWDTGTPDPAIGSDTFSVRWTGEVQALVTGPHTFYTVSDDGVRLWVNGVKLIDDWTDHGPTEDSGTINLTAGQRVSITMEFYEDLWGATARLLWSAPGVTKGVIPSSQLFPGGAPPPPPPSSAPGLAATYFDNMDLTGPSVSRVDPTVDFDWDTASPDPAIGPNTFSARWTGQVQATVAGTYLFHTVSDDGVRLWINGVKVIDHWTDHGPTEDTSAAITLAAGQKVPVVMEFYDDTWGAVAKLLWTPPGAAKQAVPASQLSH